MDCGMGLYFVTCLDTKHITCHMVPKFLYDHAKSALPSTPLPSNPSGSTVLGKFSYFIMKMYVVCTH